MNPKQRIILLVALIFGVISFGTIGYSLIEKWDIFDALYMTVQVSRYAAVAD